MTDLTVMDVDKDPYRIDTPAKRRDAQWAAELVARFIAPDRNIHPRSIFYACVSPTGETVKKPNGEVFVNTEDDAKTLSEALSYARWLGDIGFERLIDNKNDKPIVRLAPSNDPPSAHVCGDGLKIEELDADSIGVSAGLAYFEPRQPYRLVFYGEKTSLDDVLSPLAEDDFSADLYLETGQISNAHLHQIAKIGNEDGRVTVVFTFSDCDPSGYWDMPISIAHKLRALRDLLFPNFRFIVVPVALNPDQVRELGLPSSPFKEGEKRAAEWFELYRVEQTEIDALAQLRPDVLRDGPRRHRALFRRGPR